MPRRILTKEFWKKIYLLSEGSDLFGKAAQVAFYFTFSIFPFLFFLFSLSGVVLGSSASLRNEVFRFLQQIMPPSVFDLVDATLNEIITSSSGGKLTAGLLITLWTASSGIDTLRSALNSAYGLAERRYWWRTRFLAIVFTLAATILGGAGLFILLNGRGLIQKYLTGYEGSTLANALQWVILFLIVLAICESCYNFLPDHRKRRNRWISPGGMIAVLFWLILIIGLKVYLNFFDNYNRTYGSLGAVMILMLWLYLTSLSLMIGGTINATLMGLDEENSGSDS
jgi:membrane protein